MERRINPKHKELTTDEILLKLEQFCAYRERCPKEVRQKLAELGAQGETRTQIYDSLQADGFFDETRFALAFASGKFRINHWGRIRIRMELQAREISADVIRQALESIEEGGYVELLRQLLEKKRAQYAGDDNAREKTAAALIRAGFEQSLVFRYL